MMQSIFPWMGGFRNLLIFASIIPLAIVLGYQVASGTSMGYMLVVLCVGLVSIPFLLRYYEPIFVFSINSAFLFPFIPGQPEFKILMAIFVIGLAIVDRTINKKARISVPSNLMACFMYLAAVVIITGMARGGFGGRVLGSETWGAGKYLDIFKAFFVFFALASLKIPREKAGFYTMLFFLGTLTHSLSNVAYSLGFDFQWLFYFLPTQSAVLQHIGETSGSSGVVRFTGLAFSCTSIILLLLSRYGINGIINTWKFWRMFLFLGAVILSLWGGYRALIILLALILFFQFFYEGLHKTPALPIYACIMVVASILVITNIKMMPLAFQRSLSFLPIEIDSVAASDAAGTLEWRLEIWKTVIHDIPDYLLLGKGYAFSGTDYQLVWDAVEKGIFQAYEHILIDGAYHHGLLTLIIPLGIWGFIGFVWFCTSALKTLHYNYKKSPPELRGINTLLLSYFSANLLFFCTLYGQFNLDLMTFTSLLGFSMALNRSTREEEAELQQLQEELSEESEENDIDGNSEEPESGNGKVRQPAFI